MINYEAINQYQAIFGRPKMQKLWQDFLDEAAQKWQIIEQNQPDSLRLQFHSFKSSSLVFGMENFSKACAAVEEDIINGGGRNLVELIEIARLQYKQSIKEVSAYFEQDESHD